MAIAASIWLDIVVHFWSESVLRRYDVSAGLATDAARWTVSERMPLPSGCKEWPELSDSEGILSPLAKNGNEAAEAHKIEREGSGPPFLFLPANPVQGTVYGNNYLLRFSLHLPSWSVTCRFLPCRQRGSRCVSFDLAG